MGKYRTLVDNQTGDRWIEREGSWINTSHALAQEATNQVRHQGGPVGFGGGGRGHQ